MGLSPEAPFVGPRQMFAMHPKLARELPLLVPRTWFLARVFRAELPRAYVISAKHAMASAPCVRQIRLSWPVRLVVLRRDLVIWANLAREPPRIAPWMRLPPWVARVVLPPDLAMPLKHAPVWAQLVRPMHSAPPGPCVVLLLDLATLPKPALAQVPHVRSICSLKSVRLVARQSGRVMRKKNAKEHRSLVPAILFCPQVRFVALPQMVAIWQKHAPEASRRVPVICSKPMAFSAMTEIPVLSSIHAKVANVPQAPSSIALQKMNAKTTALVILQQAHASRLHPKLTERLAPTALAKPVRAQNPLRVPPTPAPAPAPALEELAGAPQVPVVQSAKAARAVRATGPVAAMSPPIVAAVVMSSENPIRANLRGYSSESRSS